MFSRSTTKYLFAGLALFCAGPSLFASTPAATFAELDGKPGLELVRAPRFSSLRFALEARDMDHDADLDIVLRNRVTRQELAWWQNDGAGRLSLGDQVKLYRPKRAPLHTLQSNVPAKRESNQAGKLSPYSFTAPTGCAHALFPCRIAINALTPAIRLIAFTPPLRGPPSSLLSH